MILFKPEHVPMILSGRKTETRRRGRKRWSVGSVHQCQTKMLRNDSVFAHVRVLDVREAWLFLTTPEDAFREGYGSVDEFVTVYLAINHVDGQDDAAVDKAFSEPIWALRFELVSSP